MHTVLTLVSTTNTASMFETKRNEKNEGKKSGFVTSNTQVGGDIFVLVWESKGN